MFENCDGRRMDDGVIGILLAHLRDLGSGELKNKSSPVLGIFFALYSHCFTLKHSILNQIKIDSSQEAIAWGGGSLPPESSYKKMVVFYYYCYNYYYKEGSYAVMQCVMFLDQQSKIQ